MSLLASACIALFNRRRTNSGALCEASYLSLGAYSLSIFFGLVGFKAAFYASFNSPPQRVRDWYPAPGMASVQTQDGQWLQLLNLDTGKAIGLLSKALDVKCGLYCGLCCSVCCCCVLCGKGEVVVRARPLFKRINNTFADGVKALTYDDVKVLFKDHNVAFCRINMPAQTAGDIQFTDLALLDPSGFVRSPLSFSS